MRRRGEVMRRRTWWALGLALLLLVAVAGCGGGGTLGSGSEPAAGPGTGGSESGGTTTLERAKQQGYVEVGFANEAPYAYATPDGRLTGEAVEVARAILKEMGITEMHGVLAEFRSLIPGLNARRFDMVTAGMFITPERCQQVAFANPEYKVGQAAAVAAGNPHDIHSYEDIASNPDVTVAVMAGGVEHNYLTDGYNVPEDRILVLQDQPSALAALQAGRADVIVMTGPSLQRLLDETQPEGVERVQDFKNPEIDGKEVVGYGATAFRKEDKDFVEAFNEGLERLKKSGKLLEIIRPFGFTEAELPGDVTADELCKGEV